MAASSDLTRPRLAQSVRLFSTLVYLYLLPPQRRLKQLKSQWGLSIWRYLLSMAGLVEVDVLEDGLRRKLVRVR